MTVFDWPCWRRDAHGPHRPWVTDSGGGHYLGDDRPDAQAFKVERNVRQVDCPGVKAHPNVMIGRTR
jgi:hypothetical protein